MFCSTDRLHPDNFPNDIDIISPTTTMSCIHCGEELLNLWEAQCCRVCLRSRIKEEEKAGWKSKKKFKEYNLNAGDLIRVWWRGNIKSAFMRLILSTGEEDGAPWIVSMDPKSGTVSCWGSHTIELSVDPMLRGGHLGIQKVL